MTVPRLKGLLDAYKRRRGRELKELARAFADPASLDELYPAAPAATGGVDLIEERWW